MPPRPLINSKIQKYYQNGSRFNGVQSRNNLPKMKDETYVINLDEYELIGTQWIVLYANSDNGKASNDATYFDSFGVEYTTKRNLKIHRRDKYHNKYF